MLQNAHFTVSFDYAIRKKPGYANKHSTIRSNEEFMEFNRRSIIHGFALFVLCCASLWRAQAGGPTWAQHFRAPGKTNNVAVAVATDHSGKVFVTGYSYNAVRTADQWTTIAYTSSGAPLWTNIYIGPGATNEQATALAVDNSGNVFVTGYSPATSIAPSYYDIVTIKYSNAGVPLWTNRYNGPADGRDHPNAIAVDDLGDVLIAGYSANLKSYPYDYDYVAIKYASTGDLLWINRHSGSGGGDDVAVALALNNQGDVVVTGSSTGPGSSTDFLTVAYSSGGAPLWTNRHDGAGNDVDTATAIAADATGNVFVTGYSAAMTGFPSDYGYVTLKYSNTGQPLWTNRYDGPNYHDYARAVAVDQQGDVFVAGRSVGNHYDFATIKYSSAGVAQWTNRYDGPGNTMTHRLRLSQTAAGTSLWPDIRSAMRAVMILRRWLIRARVTCFGPTDTADRRTVLKSLKALSWTTAAMFLCQAIPAAPVAAAHTQR